MKNPMLQLFKFAVVGIGNTCLSLAVYSAMMRALPVLPSTAAVSQLVSYSSGIILSYLLNNYWVFRNKRQASGAFLSFVVSQLGLMTLSSLAMATATYYFRSPPELIWLSVMTFITVINFTILKKWIFKSV